MQTETTVKKTIEFYYTVSCGLDGYHVQMPELPTPEEAYEIIMNTCLQWNIDPFFALAYTAWWNWGGEKKSFCLSKEFRQSKEDETQSRYMIQKQKFKPKTV